jgi:hypothetical protein
MTTMEGTGCWSGEIWRKILNSVAHKYDCGVHFNMLEGRLGYEGDEACAVEIVKEALAMIDADAAADQNIKGLLNRFDTNKKMMRI